MNTTYQDAQIEAARIAADAQEFCTLPDGRVVYQFPNNPFLYVIHKPYATRKELVEAILDQQTIARLQAAEAQVALNALTPQGVEQ